MLAILGGSGLTEFATLRIDRKQIVRTPFGEPSGPLTYGHVGETEVVFLARHGYGHTLAPHEINYRANLWALHSRRGAPAVRRLARRVRSRPRGRAIRGLQQTE